ncbi:MAG: hypothetical protein HY301_09230, partial [Verrucomicrobia bacterium]|nr:hypothetical protein [Verrucomicrobiota bacterium]
MAIVEPDEGPFLGAFHQAGANRILENVSRLFPRAFFTADAVLEEVTLPHDSGMLGRPVLPILDPLFEWLRSRWKGKQCVQVIGHQQRQIYEPVKSVLTERNRLEDFPRR